MILCRTIITTKCGDRRTKCGGKCGDRRDVPRFLNASEPTEKLVNVPSVPTFPQGDPSQEEQQEQTAGNCDDNCKQEPK